MAKKCKCGNAIPSSFVSKGKRHITQNRTKCFMCSPFKSQKQQSPELRRVNAAKKSKRWYFREKSKHGRDPIAIRRTRRKQFVLDLVGSRCQFCGYGRCLSNLGFHHVNEAEKSMPMDVKHFQYSLPALLPELKKCVVACHNCHGEIHAGLHSVESVLESHMVFQQKLSVLNEKEWSDFLLAFSDDVAPSAGIEPAWPVLETGASTD